MNRRSSQCEGTPVLPSNSRRPRDVEAYVLGLRSDEDAMTEVQKTWPHGTLLRMRTGMNSEETARIHSRIEEWNTALRDADLPALEGMVTEDCVFMAPGSSPIVGRDTFVQMMSQVLHSYRVEPRFEVHEMVVSGEWAFCRARDEATFIPREGGDSVRLSGWGMAILRNVNGTWLFARGMNTRLPDAGT